MEGNACGFLSSKHPNSIESYYTYITYVNPERLGLSDHSILHQILVRYSDQKAHLTVYFTRCTFLHACLHNRDHISVSYQASNSLKVNKSRFIVQSVTNSLTSLHMD